MDRLWSPWRYQYISKETSSSRCIFCDKAAASDDAGNLIVHRSKHAFVLLNLYPYTSGHLMVAPYAHIDTLEQANSSTLTDLIELTRLAEANIRSIYKPDGLNIGMNIGTSAGAGIAGHIHMHVLPRWAGDANFMTTVGETRVLPEALETTYARLTQCDWLQRP